MQEHGDGIHLQRHGAIEYNQQYLISLAATDSGSEVQAFLSFPLYSSFAKYESVKASVTNWLSNTNCCLLTTDIWTGCHSCSYMAVTAHTISDDWKMKSFCLATQEIVDAHTADNIADELSAVITEWQLDTKVLGITTNNAINVKNAVDSLNFTHFGCIGHTLQLSVGRGLQLGFVSCILGRVHKLVEHFHKSTNTMYALRQKQQLLGIPEHALVQQCETRWSLAFAMLERVVE